MDVRISGDSDGRRMPAAFHAEAHTIMNAHNDPTNRQRGSSQSDGRDEHAATPPQHHLHPRSSPAAASVDSFSSYINKDALLVQNRSSSPRAEDQLRDHSDPASHVGSPRPHPRHLVTTPIVSRDAFRHQHQHWIEHDLPRSANAVMSIEHLHSVQLPRQLPEHDHGRNHADVSADDSTELAAHQYRAQSAATSPSPAIDVNRLSASNLAQKDQEDATHSTYHNATMRATASLMADDSFESTASVMGEDSKNEIRRRRRTRPDEANLLAQVYLKNPFPDHETRLFLANRVGMSVRRQAEKKRSGRYGGSGVAPTNPAPSITASGAATPTVEESPVRPHVVLAQRKPLGNSAANTVGPTKRFDPQELNDLSNNNKENLPPWLAGRETLEKIKHDVPVAALSKPQILAPRPATRDLRQAVGPQGAGITTHRVEFDAVPVKTAPAVDVASSSKAALLRHPSVPRLSLDDVLSGRSNSLRRSATDHSAPLTTAASSELEEEQLDTILPPPKLLSRASSSSSLSLLTTSGGRASIGNLDFRKEASPVPKVNDAKPSLTSSLPPKLTAALQRLGIIGAQPDERLPAVKAQGLLHMMPSSSASSSEADTFYNNHSRRDSEEDEERTLKLIAQRRAAKAQATALAKAQQTRALSKTQSEPNITNLVAMNPGCTDARQAIVQQAFGSGDISLGSVGKKSGATVVGLAPTRQLSLDWAAGRNRASTSALPNSVGGTPLSRSVSARQLTMHKPNESTPIASQHTDVGNDRSNAALSQGEKKKKNKKKNKNESAAAARRSLSATDLTRRLQEAKRKGDAAKSSTASRKRSSEVLEVRDENVDPTSNEVGTAKSAAMQIAQNVQPLKRRRAQLEEIVSLAPLSQVEASLPPPKFSGGMASPMLSSRPFVAHASFPSAASRSMSNMMVPSTPQSTTCLYGGGMPLSTRSDRFRAIGASPVTTNNSLGRSVSAHYPSSHHRHSTSKSTMMNRASVARDQMARGGGGGSGGGLVGWDGSHARTYSEDSCSGWIPLGFSRNGGGESLSQTSLAMTTSTPSRVLLSDKTNYSVNSMSGLSHAGVNTSSDSPFMHHDDSGFFGSFSEDDQDVLQYHSQPQQQQSARGGGAFKRGTPKKGKGVVTSSISPRKASLRNMRGAAAITHGGGGSGSGDGENRDDHQAAELLLGLGKTVESRDSSLSQ
ncbi:uncharacterized protein MEPE_00298 [Melanopsichium pennsylvanicum]|uniref:Homeobox domain-containing protein n=1 Tax=Melanopsichium pennsylvanicum TaxID=63383 RepID=A0AAJ4XI43_9BASI|nr:uncharacterized protein MEPE_00298 [Melanopsichium pennsylvanicum]